MHLNDEIWLELKKLRLVYDDLRKEISNITNKQTDATQTSRRGALTTSGVTAEAILKYIYKNERKDKNGKPAEKLMLDELISELSERQKPSLLPHHIITHLRTVQAWRNIAGHDKGDITDVSNDTLIAVNIALNAVVSWFFESYLGGEYAQLAVNHELPINAKKPEKKILENEQIWVDYYWYAMRNEEVRGLDISYLNSLQEKQNIPEDRILSLKSTFKRNITTFQKLIEEAFEDKELEKFEAEAIEHARVACCISVKEAKEIFITKLRSTNLISFLIDKDSGIEWIDECKETIPLSGSPSEMPITVDAPPQADILPETRSSKDNVFFCVFNEDLAACYQTGPQDFMINFKPSYLNRLDFSFVINKEKIQIYSKKQKIFILYLSESVWLQDEETITKDLTGTNGVVYDMKIRIPDSQDNFLPDWKKRILAIDADKDIEMIIERIPSDETVFMLTISAGKIHHKNKLTIGTYLINQPVDLQAIYPTELNQEILSVLKQNQPDDILLESASDIFAKHLFYRLMKNLSTLFFNANETDRIQLLKNEGFSEISIKRIVSKFQSLELHNRGE